MYCHDLPIDRGAGFPTGIPVFFARRNDRNRQGMQRDSLQSGSVHHCPIDCVLDPGLYLAKGRSCLVHPPCRRSQEWDPYCRPQPAGNLRQLELLDGQSSILRFLQRSEKSARKQNPSHRPETEHFSGASAPLEND